MIGYAYLPVALGPGTEVTVEVLGDWVDATVVDDVLYDPTHATVRA
jgi:glycine cleavage system aminomethyltransferase T